MQFRKIWQQVTCDTGEFSNDTNTLIIAQRYAAVSACLPPLHLNKSTPTSLPTTVYIITENADVTFGKRLFARWSLGWICVNNEILSKTRPQQSKYNATNETTYNEFHGSHVLSYDELARRNFISAILIKHSFMKSYCLSLVIQG